MVEIQSGRQTLLVRGQSVRNGLNRALIAAILFVVLAPFVLVLSYIISAGLTELAKAGSQIIAGVVWSQHRIGAHRGVLPGPSQAPDRVLILKMLPWTVDFLAAGMVIVLWGMSSASANLLARLGARSARTGGAGGNALGSLLTLSLSAGLSPPKLYVVQSSFPTVFSDALDVRHPMVAVTTGALDLLEDREVDALLAHELSHIANHDDRLERMLASLAAIIEFPSRMFQRKPELCDGGGWTRNVALLEVLLSPLSLYIFFVSPLLNALIRTVVLRKREFHADTEATLITGDPEALVTALAKIGGVVTVLGAPTVGSLPAHRSLSQRIERVMAANAACAFKGLEQAIARGKQYAKERQGMGHDQPGLMDTPSHLSELQETGRVYQLVASEAIPLFDGPGPGAMVRRRMEPGALLVVFEGQGKMRQVNTAEEVFGYLSREVKLKAVEGVLPQEVYEPEARAAIEEVLRREGQLAPLKKSAVEHLTGLTKRQLRTALVFGAAVFAGTSVLMFVFAGH